MCVWGGAGGWMIEGAVAYAHYKLVMLKTDSWWRGEEREGRRRRKGFIRRRRRSGGGRRRRREGKGGGRRTQAVIKMLRVVY